MELSAASPAARRLRLLLALRRDLGLLLGEGGVALPLLGLGGALLEQVCRQRGARVQLVCLGHLGEEPAALGEFALGRRELLFDLLDAARGGVDLHVGPANGAGRRRGALLG